MLIKNEIIIALMIPFSVITSYYLSALFLDNQYLTNLDIFLEHYYNSNKDITILYKTNMVQVF